MSSYVQHFCWMTSSCFACVPVIWYAIYFIRLVYQSWDSEDSENIWFYPKKHSPILSINQNEKGSKNPVSACSYRKIKKIPGKIKIYNLKTVIFEFSNFFWYKCFFDLRKNVGKKRIFSQNDMFCHLVFNLFWWMTLGYFSCISVIFQVITFVR